MATSSSTSSEQIPTDLLNVFNSVDIQQAGAANPSAQVPPGAIVPTFGSHQPIRQDLGGQGANTAVQVQGPYSRQVAVQEHTFRSATMVPFIHARPSPL